MTKSRSQLSSLNAHLASGPRVLNAMRGVLPAAIAMPLVLQAWTPTWFVIAWLVAYLLISFGFSYLVLSRTGSSAGRTWPIVAGLLFCMVPISVVIWSPSAEHYWASATVCIVFIAFEMSALPFLRIGEWRVGVLAVASPPRFAACW